MVQHSVSQRGSFSVPVHINLLSARRSYSRHNLNLLGEASSQSQPVERRMQVQASSVGEDRAIILGFTMIGFSVLMYFLFGFTIVKPYLHSRWSETSTCTLIHANILNDVLDCREKGTFPCLEVKVNISLSSWAVTLRYNEVFDPLHKCFFVPKCQQSKSDVLEEARRIQLTLQELGGRPFTCLFSPEEPPVEVILCRKYNGWLVAHCLWWPTLILVGGASIISLVKLTQKLAHMCLSLQASEGTARDAW